MVTQQFSHAQFPIEILIQIGEFFLEKNGSDYQKTTNFLRSLEISSVELDQDEVTVSLRRPGLLIGFRGQTLTELSEFLGKKVLIKEDISVNVYDYLIPMIPSDLDEITHG